MAEPKMEVMGTVKLAEILADKFVDCIIKFNNGDWEPYFENKSTVNFLKIQNDAKSEKIFGTNGFMKSVAKNANIFLIDAQSYKGDSYPKHKYDTLNKSGDMKIIKINTFSETASTTLENLLNDNIELLPDSMTVISTRRGREISFPGGQKSSDWGDETPPNQTPLNTTDSSKTQNPLNIPRTNEEKRYAYYKTLARPEQSRFRTMLLKEYNTTCMITGCTTKVALEAAHIIPFSQDGEDTLENGLLLRADLHLLFDKGFMAIDPNTGDPDTGIVHFRIADKRYDAYNQKSVDISKASQINLTAHWQKYNE